MNRTRLYSRDKLRQPIASKQASIKAATEGEPGCPRCGCCVVYTYKARRIFKCQGCGAQFSVTTDTIFASRKMVIRDLLAAIAIFANGAKGYSALQLSRDLDCQHKTAFVLAHKLREALGAENRTRTVKGEVEIDGAYFGGYVKPENRKEDRKDLRLKANQSGNAPDGFPQHEHRRQAASKGRAEARRGGAAALPG